MLIVSKNPNNSNKRNSSLVVFLGDNFQQLPKNFSFAASVLLTYDVEEPGTVQYLKRVPGISAPRA